MYKDLYGDPNRYPLWRINYPLGESGKMASQIDLHLSQFEKLSVYSDAEEIISTLLDYSKESRGMGVNIFTFRIPEKYLGHMLAPPFSQRRAVTKKAEKKLNFRADLIKNDKEDIEKSFEGSYYIYSVNKGDYFVAFTSNKHRFLRDDPVSFQRRMKYTPNMLNRKYKSPKS